ncbi:hypothetical protein ASZ86_00051 [Vibrio cholerae]|nr:hypothetical protein ASZ86_00051 [Vibrio cholerae]
MFSLLSDNYFRLSNKLICATGLCIRFDYQCVTWSCCMKLLGKSNIRIFELNDEQRVPEEIYQHSIIIGFGSVRFERLGEDIIEIEMVLAPLSEDEGKADVSKAISMFINIANLGFLASRMIIRQGCLQSRIVKNQYGLRMHFPTSALKPAFVKTKDITSIGSIYGDQLDNLGGLADSYVCKISASRLDIGQEVEVYVPCAELLRFYLPHTSLVNAAFSGKDASECLYNPETPRTHPSKAIVQLRRSIPDICAPHVGRYCYDSYAENTFQRIFTDTMYGDGINPSQYLRISPPLRGDCDWLVEAEELDRGVFFITGIYRCDAPFPFDDLIFGRDNDGRTPEDRGLPIDINYFPMKQAVIENNQNLTEPLIHALNGNAELQIETLDIHFDFEEGYPSFGYLEKSLVKKIEKGAVQKPESMNIKYYSSSELVTGIALSGHLSQGNDYKFVKAEISNGKVKKSSIDDKLLNLSAQDAFSAFHEAMMLLENDFNVDWRNITGYIKDHSLILNMFEHAVVKSNMFLCLDKKSYLSCDVEERQKFVRKFVVAEVSNDEGGVVYLVDFEKHGDSSSVLFFYHFKGDRLEDSALREHIIEFTKDRRKWSQDEKPVFRGKMNHDSDLEAFSEKLKKVVTLVFEEL